ncbi:MAG: cyclic nucleotide-binding domain-containing protein, partial [Alcanivorax sp.]
MRLRPEQLGKHLADRLLPAYLVAGDEPLQQGELLDDLRDERKLAVQQQLMGRVPLLSGLSERERNVVAGALVERTYKAGDTVIQAGTVGDTFHIILSGEATVTGRN